ncbi:hypothetical protein SeMB42_g02870, partial [Synchytrium endobioticum]
MLEVYSALSQQAIFRDKRNSSEQWDRGTIDRTTPMKRPVPSMLKVSPKVVEYDDDKTKAADDDDSDGPETSKKNFSDATRAIVSLSD